MATYWITFRIEADSNYEARYDALHKAIDKACSAWWLEPTSFYLIQSDLKIDQLAATIKAAINPRVDMALIGMPDYKSARVVGKVEYLDSLKALLPFVNVV
jgi:hypothetical protein